MGDLQGAEAIIPVPLQGQLCHVYAQVLGFSQ